MITITKLSISNDLKTMSLDITVASGKLVTSLKLWTSSTFKDAAQEVDLTSKLAGTTNTESLTLTTSDIGGTNLSDLYFLEIGSNDVGDTNAVVAVINLRQFYGVVVALLFTVLPSCLNCNTNLQNALLLDLYMEAITRGLQVGRFQDAITFFNKINIVTNKVDCKDCFNQVVTDPGDGWVSIGVLDCILDLE